MTFALLETCLPELAFNNVRVKLGPIILDVAYGLHVILPLGWVIQKNFELKLFSSIKFCLRWVFFP